MASVPRHAALKPNTLVKIVLKEDQRTGKLTTGVVADILTRGDHPRGVKVRLSNGLIGRVQSLAAPGAGNSTTQTREHAEQNQQTTPARNFRFQDDFRKTEAPPSQPTSLSDYIKAPSRNSKKKKAKESESAEAAEEEESSDQARLESMFPTIDSALVAAILGDSGSAAEATETLQALS